MSDEDHELVERYKIEIMDLIDRIREEDDIRDKELRNAQSRIGSLMEIADDLTEKLNGAEERYRIEAVKSAKLATKVNRTLDLLRKSAPIIESVGPHILAEEIKSFLAGCP